MQTSNQTYGAGESYDSLHKNKDYEKDWRTFNNST